MARNTGRSALTGKFVTGSSQKTTASRGLWTKRNPVSGKFTKAKTTGVSFKGVRRAG